YLLPVHLEKVASGLDLLLGHARVVHGSRRVDPELLRMGTVSMQVEAENAPSVVLAEAKGGRTGAISEDHRSIAAPGAHIEASRLDLRTHHQHPAELSAADEGIRHRERVDEAAALIPDVDGGDRGQSQQPLEEDAVARS